MTKAFLLGFIAGASRDKRRMDNPYNYDKEDYTQWDDGYMSASDPWEDSMQDILKLGE